MEWEWNPAIRAIIFIYSQLKRRKKNWFRHRKLKFIKNKFNSFGKNTIPNSFEKLFMI